MDVINYMPEINLQSCKQSIQDILDQTNKDIKELDEKITIRELYNRIGLKSERKYPDEYIDCWGWDKKGFRKLYSIVTELREVE